MQVASMAGVLKTVLGLLIGWFILRRVSQFFGGTKRQAASRTKDRRPTEPGTVRIDHNTPPKKGASTSDAEFVEFEEIKDPIDPS